MMTGIKNLSTEKLSLAAVYRYAKFRDDTTTFSNFFANLFKIPLPPIQSDIKPH